MQPLRTLSHEADPNERLRAIVQNAFDGLMTIDRNGLIETFNPAGERMFGYSAAEVEGQNVNILMPELCRTEHGDYMASYHDAFEAKIIGTVVRELMGRRKDGSLLPLALTASSFELVDGTHYCAIVRDITVRRQAEQQIRRHLISLKRSNQELDDFAHIASHDLKEPLRGLSNNALFLKEDFEKNLDEAGVKRIDRMVYLCERMERLVNDLLYFSRLGRQELAVQQTDLNAVIKDIEFMMEGMLQESGAKIVIDQPLPSIVCDLPRITEVFRNLITNAVKYNDKPEKRIHIGARQHADELAFYVRDNGIGIPQQFHDDVFRIFKRLNEESDAIRGMGVGLTFVKKIIERHDGKIWIESKAGEGTTFNFTINHPKEIEA